MREVGRERAGECNADIVYRRVALHHLIMEYFVCRPTWPLSAAASACRCCGCGDGLTISPEVASSATWSFPHFAMHVPIRLLENVVSDGRIGSTRDRRAAFQQVVTDFVEHDVVIEVLAGIGKESAAVVVAAVAHFLHEEVEIDSGSLVCRVKVFHAPQQERVRSERIEGVDGGFQVAEEGDRGDDQEHDIRRPKKLEGMLFVLFQYGLAERFVIFRLAARISSRRSRKASRSKRSTTSYESRSWPTVMP